MEGVARVSRDERARRELSFGSSTATEPLERVRGFLARRSVRRLDGRTSKKVLQTKEEDQKLAGYSFLHQKSYGVQLQSASCLPCDRLKCELEFLGLREAGLGLLCSDLFEKRVVFSSTESGDERIDR